ncbi:MAG TPA: transposase [Bryobacteraceae bacterium]|nr:transposase [Bryobacteraceae bacterium]
MPRANRIVIPGIPHHVTQRGNYRQQVFFREGDRLFYLDLLAEFSNHYGVSIEAYCLMPNHVHLVLVPHGECSLPRLLQRIQSEYARVLNLRLHRAGHLWQGRYYSVPMAEDHFASAMVYVEQNPSRAGLVKGPADWRWSSARGHLGMRNDPLLNLVRWRSSFTSASWKSCLELGLRDGLLLERIREATLTGRPFGGEDFLQRLEDQFGKKVRPGGPGRRAAQGAL